MGAVALTAAASAAVDLEADPVAALAAPVDLAEDRTVQEVREVLIGAGAAFGVRAITDLTATATAAVASAA